MASEMSTPTTLPLGPTAAAAENATLPVQNAGAHGEASPIARYAEPRQNEGSSHFMR